MISSPSEIMIRKILPQKFLHFEKLGQGGWARVDKNIYPLNERIVAEKVAHQKNYRVAEHWELPKIEFEPTDGGVIVYAGRYPHVATIPIHWMWSCPVCTPNPKRYEYKTCPCCHNNWKSDFRVWPWKWIIWFFRCQKKGSEC